MSPEYLAGIVDGEGYVRISVSNYKYQYVRLQVTNTHKPLLDAIQRAYGGVVADHDSKRHERNPKWSPCWKWDTAGVNAVAILRLILPHLIVKRDDALRALEGTAGKVAA